MITQTIAIVLSLFAFIACVANIAGFLRFRRQTNRYAKVVACKCNDCSIWDTCRTYELRCSSCPETNLCQVVYRGGIESNTEPCEQAQAVESSRIFIGDLAAAFREAAAKLRASQAKAPEAPRPTTEQGTVTQGCDSCTECGKDCAGHEASLEKKAD